MMKEKPIIFNQVMVKAIMEGTKTQTRRIVKKEKKPYDKGDTLWVRETFQGLNLDQQWWHEVPPAERPLHNWAFTNPYKPAFDGQVPRWLPAIHMPRYVCRLMLRVESVRRERLQEITLADAWAEGVKTYFEKKEGLPGDELHSINVFRSLWNEINFKRGYGWNVNPSVWVIKFCVIRA